MPFAPLNPVFGTLRFRLMLWNTAVVLLMVLPTLVVVRETLRHTLRHELDQLLREDVLEVDLLARQLRDSPEELRQELTLKARSHAHRGWFVQLFDGDGGLVWQAATPEIDLPPPARRGAAIDVGGYRVAEAAFERPTASVAFVRVGSSLEELQRDVALLTHMMTLAGGLILVLAPLGGYWLAGRATRPLTRIIDTAERLRPSNLAERLPVRGSGDELDRLSQTINGMLDRIAAYLERRRDFLTNAAHELRSPVSAIRATVEVTLSGRQTKEECDALLGEVLEECDALAALVNRLLLLAESDAGRPEPSEQSTDLAAAVRKSAEMFHGAAEACGVELVVPRLDPAVVPGEESALRQVLNNLLDNALEFTPEGGRVTVEVRRGAEAELVVEDTGTGIAPADLPRVFDRFYRGDRSRQRRGGGRGSGLGLSICQAIVTGLGGRIDVVSEPGRGSRFTVVLPLRGPAQ
jgi:heavy metal sensor kinase